MYNSDPVLIIEQHIDKINKKIDNLSNKEKKYSYNIVYMMYELYQNQLPSDINIKIEKLLNKLSS